MNVIAADGHIARAGGVWTRDKLTYQKRYAAAFMTAMTPKRTQGKWNKLISLDFLCGPGIDVIEGREHRGSPLIAVDTIPQFDRIYLGDLNARNVSALRHRLPQEDLGRVDLKAGDCHSRAVQVVKELGTKTLGFAFIDPEGFEVRFELFETLAQRPIDILLLFPSGIGKRNLQQYARTDNCQLDKMWGNRDWRKLPVVRRIARENLTVSEGEQVVDISWAQAFRERIATLGYKHHDASPQLRNDQNVPLYQLLFFSKDEAGLKIWRGISKIEPGGQRRLWT